MMNTILFRNIYIRVKKILFLWLWLSRLVSIVGGDTKLEFDQHCKEQVTIIM